MALHEMKTKQPTPLSVRDIASQAMESLVEFANERGRKVEIAEALTALTGQEVKRQQVEKWLHADPDKREVPNLGAGIALALVVSKLQSPLDPLGPIGKTATVSFSITRPKTKRTTKKEPTT